LINDHEKELLISIVSHNHGDQVKKLLDCIEMYCNLSKITVALTLNVKESLPFEIFNYSFPIFEIQNKKPKGFGTNHNKAFSLKKCNFYCILNPDVYFSADPFPALIDDINLENAGIIGPTVYNSTSELEDTARMHPTPLRLLIRQFKKHNDYNLKKTYQEVDWVAGMFMLFKSEVFKKLNGFDEWYFLYCEDTDICARVWLNGSKVIWNNTTKVFHDAHRSSHSNLKYLTLHLISLTRLFLSSVYYKRFFQKLSIKLHNKGVQS